MAFGNLTVDFRQLSKIPVRDRVALAQSPQASSIFGNMSPSEIAALFPDYYKRFMPTGGGASMSAGMTGAGTTGTGTSTSTSTTSTSTATSTSTTTSTRPGYIEEILTGVQSPSAPAGTVVGNKFEGSFSQKSSYLTSRLMKDLGLTKEQAAGFVGNLAHESAGLQVDIEEYAANVHGTRGYGLAQWTDNPPGKGRRTNLINFAKERNIPVNDFETQYQFLLYELNGVESKALGKIKSARTIEEAAAAGVFFERPKGFTAGMWKSNDLIGSAKQAHGWDQRFSYAKKSLQAYEDAVSSMQISQELPGTAPQTGEAPQGSDVTVENLKGTPADRSATVVPAPKGAAKTLLLSMGTNDWGNPEKTYQNTLDAINEGRRKGYNVVVVPPTGSLERIKKAHDEVMRAVAETGASIEQPMAYSSDGYHPTPEEYKRIAKKFPASVVVGDSIAQGIGTYMDNGKVVATQSIQTDVILANLRSEQVAQQETAQVSASVNFDASVFTQLDPRLKEWYDKASDSDKLLLQAAIQQKGIASLNETMAKYPKTTATAAGTTAFEEIGEITNVRYGDVGQRDAPVDPALQKKISAMITDIYGPEYEAVIHSGGESLTGAKVSKSGRHDVKFDANGNVIGGQAADVYIRNRETGEVVPRAQQIKAAQYWQAKEFGGVGLGMKGGAIHLDQVQRGKAKGPELAYRVWAYGEGDPSQSNLTEAERSAMVQARSEDFDIGTIVRPKEPQPAQTLPGTEPQTQAAPTSETDVQPLQQANTNMALGGTKSLDVEPNMVNEKYTITQTDPKTGQTKPIANFNKEEEVNIKDGQMNVESAYKKKSQETIQKTDTGTPKTNQYNMRQSTDRQNDELGRQIKDGIVPDSPSFRRSVYHSRFGVEHFNRGAKSQYS